MTTLRSAARSLMSQPRVSAVAMVLLALGIGANVVLFALADAVMFRPFPFTEPDRLVIGGELHAGVRSEVPYPDYVDFLARTRTFVDLAAMASSNWTTTIQGSGEPAPIDYRPVSGNFFDVLGARAAIGRTLRPDDDRHGAGLAVVLSDGLWRRQFGADPHVLGRSVVLGRRLHTIVGVMPRGFTYPDRLDVWVALVPEVERFPIPGEPDFVENRNVSVLLFVGRLKAKTTVDAARRDLDSVLRDIAATFGGSRSGTAVAPLVDDTLASARSGLWALLAAVALLVTAAAANVAGLLLVRVSARQHDFAIRLALGASRWALARDLLAEAALLTAISSAVAFVAARAALPLLVAIVPQQLPRVEEAVVGLRALVYTFALGAVIVGTCGLLPLATLHPARLELALRAGGRTATLSRPHRRSRHVIVGAEVAIAVIVLTGAALLYRSVAELTRLDIGFAPDRLLAIEVHAPASLAQRADLHAFYATAIDAIRRVPSVESAAGVAGRPLKGPIGLDSSWQREGQDVKEAERNPWANLETITPTYFDTMGIRLLQGRGFTDDDRTGTAPVAIVGETFARRTWPGESAVGKHVRGHGFNESRTASPWWTVVGVAADVRYRDLRSPTLDVYVPFAQSEFSIGDLVVRTRGPAEASIGAVRAQLRSVDADGLIRLAVMSDEIAREERPWRTNLLFFAFFAALTALIAVVGLYGLFASVVAEQTHEFGVRMALGATTARIVGDVLASAGRTVGAGAVVGLGGAIASTRLIGAMLFSVSPLDALTLAAAPAALLLVSLAATLVSARRIGRVDPAVSLHTE